MVHATTKKIEKGTFFRIILYVFEIIRLLK